jgi:hypothetical protein
MFCPTNKCRANDDVQAVHRIEVAGWMGKEQDIHPGPASVPIEPVLIPRKDRETSAMAEGCARAWNAGVTLIRWLIHIH